MDNIELESKLQNSVGCALRVERRGNSGRSAKGFRLGKL